MRDEPLLGAHISIAGGLHTALHEGRSIGATTIQLFTASQRRWVSKALSESECTLFQEAMKKTGLRSIMSHASYLINLGSPKEEVRRKSIEAFRAEIERCQLLGISFLTFHPGAALDSLKEVCIDAIVHALLSMEDLLDPSLVLLLETTAGQGTTIGSSFEELAAIIDRVHMKIPIGVCLDTCHIFAAGYDLRSAEAVQETLSLFDQIVGLRYLRAVHLNDSIFDLGQHRDRHAPLGEGKIGKEGFVAIMNHPSLARVPKYLETPGGL